VPPPQDPSSLFTSRSQYHDSPQRAGPPLSEPACLPLGLPLACLPSAPARRSPPTAQLLQAALLAASASLARAAASISSPATGVGSCSSAGMESISVRSRPQASSTRSRAGQPDPRTQPDPQPATLPGATAEVDVSHPLCDTRPILSDEPDLLACEYPVDSVAIVLGEARASLSDFFDEPQGAAVLKHEVLRQYLRIYGGKTGSRTGVVLVDGYAGPGRYADESPGSPELMVNTARALRTENVHCVFVERERRLREQLKTLLVG
jgi:hypothetical protein